MSKNNNKLSPSDLIGLTESEATKEIESAGCCFHIRRRDGVSFPSVAGYRADRLNLVIKDDVVISATFG